MSNSRPTCAKLTPSSRRSCIRRTASTLNSLLKTRRSRFVFPFFHLVIEHLPIERNRLNEVSTKSGQAHVVIHGQASVDGRIDWLPIDPGLFYEIAAHWKEDATVAGTDTLLAAAEMFDEQSPDEGDSMTGNDGPLLVVPDSRGRMRHWETLLRSPYWGRGVALCTETTPEEHLKYLGEVGVETLMVGEEPVDFRAALECLADRYGVKTVRVDSGGTLNGVLLRAGLVDEVSVLVSPYLVGGVTAKSLYRAPDLTDSAGVIGLRLTGVQELRDGVVWLRYTVLHDS